MVWPCKRNDSLKAFQTSFTSKSKRKKTSETTVNTLTVLH